MLRRLFALRINSAVVTVEARATRLGVVHGCRLPRQRRMTRLTHFTTRNMIRRFRRRHRGHQVTIGANRRHFLMIDPNHRQPRLRTMAGFATGTGLQMGWRFAARSYAIMATGTGAISRGVIRGMVENHADCA